VEGDSSDDDQWDSDEEGVTGVITVAFVLSIDTLGPVIELAFHSALGNGFDARWDGNTVAQKLRRGEWARLYRFQKRRVECLQNHFSSAGLGRH